jgi:pimeloyl-ACP methyl ester carboxylesterase
MTIQKYNSLKSLTLVASLAAACTGTSHAAGTSYQTVEVDGLKIFYREAGQSAKPTIVLLHGFPSSSHMFRDLIPLLSRDFHVIAPDYPGMGQSEAPASGAAVTFDYEAASVEHLLKKLGTTKAILYMQDFGGPIGMRIATQHPEWVAGLIFQNIAITEDGWEPARLNAVKANKGPATQEKRAAAEGRVSVATDLNLYRHGAADEAKLNPDAWVSDAFAISNADSHRVMTDLQLDIPSNLDLYGTWAQYLSTKKPKTLVVWGDNDPIFTSHGADAIGALVPGSSVKHYNAGHFALEEQSDDIAAQVIENFASANH